MTYNWAPHSHVPHCRGSRCIRGLIQLALPCCIPKILYHRFQISLKFEKPNQANKSDDGGQQIISRLTFLRHISGKFQHTRSLSSQGSHSWSCFEKNRSMPFWDMPRHILSLEGTERAGICLHFPSSAKNLHHCSQSRVSFPSQARYPSKSSLSEGTNGALIWVPDSPPCVHYARCFGHSNGTYTRNPEDRGVSTFSSEDVSTRSIVKDDSLGWGLGNMFFRLNLLGGRRQVIYAALSTSHDHLGF
jgi:hypothetical protein